MRNKTRSAAHTGRVVMLCVLNAAAIIATAWLARFTIENAQVLANAREIHNPQVAAKAIETAMAGLATTGLAWLSFLILLVTLCSVGRFSRRGWVAGERLLRRMSPRLARYALTTVIGVGMGAATLAPAHAASQADPFDVNLTWAGQSQVVQSDDSAPNLGFSASEAPPAQQSREPGPASDSEDAGSADEASETVTVKRGDSLWSIAETHLGSGATNAQIDREWREWYAQNSEVIGANPNLITPGTQLQAPE